MKLVIKKSTPRYGPPILAVYLGQVRVGCVSKAVLLRREPNTHGYTGDCFLPGCRRHFLCENEDAGVKIIKTEVDDFLRRSGLSQTKGD